MIDSKRKLIESRNFSSFINNNKSDIELMNIIFHQEQLDQNKHQSIPKEKIEVLVDQNMHINKDNSNEDFNVKSSYVDNDENFNYKENFSYNDMFNPLNRRISNKNIDENLLSTLILKDNTLEKLTKLLNSYQSDSYSVRNNFEEKKENNILSVQTSILENDSNSFNIENKNEYLIEATHFIKKFYYEKIILEFLDKYIIIFKNFHYEKLAKMTKFQNERIIDIDDKKQLIKEKDKIYFKEEFARKGFRKLVLSINKKITSLIFKKYLIVENKKKKNITSIDLEFYNDNNNLLKYFIMKIIESPFDDEYRLWKFYLSKLSTTWKLLEVNNLNYHYKLKYLKIKLLIQKIQDLKRVKIFSNLIEIKQETKNLPYIKIIIRYLINILFKFETNRPRLSFSPDSISMLLFNFIVDLQVIYIMIFAPIVYVIKLDNEAITFIDQSLSGLYFMNIVVSFRTLYYNETNKLITDLNSIFIQNIYSLLFFLDLISLLPLIVYFSDSYQNDPNSFYFSLKLLPLVRIFRFGKTIETLERSKYAVVSRIFVLIGKFFIFSTWIGLLFIYIETSFKYFDSDNFKMEPDCIIYGVKRSIEIQCKYLIAIYNGGYIISGGYINGIDMVKNTSYSVSEFIYLFFAYFIGMIITAYIFGGVSNVIENFNRGRNLYVDKVDIIKSYMMFYKFDDSISNDIKLYYENLWLKHRDIIYGKSLFYGMSNSILIETHKNIYSHYNNIFKTLISISKNENFVSSIVTSFKKYIAFPFERVYIQGCIIKGLFILVEGETYFTDGVLKSEEKKSHDFRYDLVNKIRVYKDESLLKKYSDETMIYQDNIFPIDCIFFKTGRAIETCYVKDFTDFFIIELNFFDEYLLENFPIEMKKLKEKGYEIGIKKLGEINKLKEMIFTHSSRSLGKYYQIEYNLNNIWIEIPSVISNFIGNYQENGLGNGLTNNKAISLNLVESKGVMDIDFDLTRKLLSY